MSAHNVPLGVYVPGDTVLHRARPGHKMLGLILFLVVSTLAIHHSPPVWALACGAAALGLALGGYVLARIPLATACGQLLGPLVLIVPFGALLAWRSGVLAGVVSILGVYSAVVAATLVTLTTTVADMMDALETALRPFARIGLPVDSIVLAFSLTLRLIPLMLGTASEVLEAQRARGLTGPGRALTAFGIPLMVRTLVRAKALGEAMISRGVDD
ncbi:MULTISPECIES: energy-coupling factor transporter transmembrane protein EcfT [Corynebacterium]|uniref:energy-coupling factor transporter transmembrane component T family protein n=1 Tax=Corynebacterium TaxID=1716 RepID=UPI001CE48BFB|nr:MULTISPECIES: energy-coupling factor transporter transmembrane protein EcfT [Corynebacterium]